MSAKYSAVIIDKNSGGGWGGKSHRWLVGDGGGECVLEIVVRNAGSPCHIGVSEDSGCCMATMPKEELQSLLLRMLAVACDENIEPPLPDPDTMLPNTELVVEAKNAYGQPRYEMWTHLRSGLFQVGEKVSAGGKVHMQSSVSGGSCFGSVESCVAIVHHLNCLKSLICGRVLDSLADKYESDS